jgi:Prophage minor tail protein Z (GPZ)
MRYSVELDLTQVKRYASDVQKKYVPAAAGIALKRVGTTARNAAAVKIRERLAVKAAVAKGALKVQRIGNGMTIWITATGKPIPLRDYEARATRRARRVKGIKTYQHGVTFRVSRLGKRKQYSREGRPGFIIQSKGGHVFVRTADDPPGEAKAPIKKVYGPSVPQYFVTKVIIQAMEQVARERWPLEFAAALRGVLIRRTGVDVGATLGGLG